MKFFVPFATGRSAAERTYSEVRDFTIRQTGWEMMASRVFALRYRLKDREYLAQVGIPHPPGPEAETVVCILQTVGFFLICTRRHGVECDLPLMIPRGRVSDVEYFNNVRDEIA
jgi:hypothetical protein